MKQRAEQFGKNVKGRRLVKMKARKELKLEVPCNIGDELFKIIDSPWVERAKQILKFKVTGFHIYEEVKLIDSEKPVIKSKILFKGGYNDASADFSDVGNSFLYCEEDAINKLYEMGYCKKCNCGQILAYVRELK